MTEIVSFYTIFLSLSFSKAWIESILQNILAQNQNSFCTDNF